MGDTAKNETKPSAKRERFDSCPIETVQIVLTTVIYLIVGMYAARWGYIAAILLGYAVGGTCINSATLGMHEATHGLVWGKQRKLLNDISGVIASVPFVLPAFFPFKHFHLIHHAHTNVDGEPPADPDMPTHFEQWLFNSSLPGRWVGMFFQQLAYSIRPTIAYKYVPGPLEILNGLFNLAVHYGVWRTSGTSDLAYVAYVLSSIMLGLAFHPCAMHFYAEHSGLDPKAIGEAKGGSQAQPLPVDTWSYYGFWNLFIYNVGYHKEHHDNMAVAGYYLPAFREKNRDKYGDSEAVYPSYTKILFDLFFKRVDLYRNRNDPNDGRDHRR
mmetsp:Transcript_8349/g.14326  ORF Transcript_8349/g.14326 Transcript_8349/m.14326 type:complete len:327 (+) Transcript_8349:87-1067(+)